MSRLPLAFFLLLVLWPVPAAAGVCAHEAELALPEPSVERDWPADLLAAPGGPETLGRIGANQQHAANPERDPRGPGSRVDRPVIASPTSHIASVADAGAVHALLPDRFAHVPYLPTSPPAQP